MISLSPQNDSGRSFDYGLAVGFSNALDVNPENNSMLVNAQRCFENCSETEKEKIRKLRRRRNNEREW